MTTEATQLLDHLPTTEVAVKAAVAESFADRFRAVPMWAVLVAPVLASLGVGAYQLSLPHVLFGVHGYDVGVYLGAPIRLLQGFLPYRDFAVLYPPGSILVLAPVAALGRMLGSTRDALAIARCFCIATVGLNVFLASFAVRRFGRLAALVTGLALASWPIAVSVQNMELEPFFMCFCLIGTILAFSPRDDNARRMVWAGVAFGYAGTIRIWAIAPVIALLICFVWTRARRTGAFVTGVVLGFAVPSLPFFVAAPRAFINDTVFIPLTLGESLGHGALTLPERLVMITGIWGLPGMQAAKALATVIILVIGVLALGTYGPRLRQVEPLEWFIAIASLFALITVFLPAQFWDHFAYFPAVFLAMLLGVVASQLGGLGMRFLARFEVRRAVRDLLRITAIGIVLGLAGYLVGESVNFSSLYLSTAYDPGAGIARVVPRHACVVFDSGVLLISANRYDAPPAGCPATVDPYAFWATTDASHPPPYFVHFPSSLVRSWRGWLGVADYVVLVGRRSDYVPWTSSLNKWFNANYQSRYQQFGAAAYRHRD